MHFIVIMGLTFYASLVHTAHGQGLLEDDSNLLFPDDGFEVPLPLDLPSEIFDPSSTETIDSDNQLAFDETTNMPECSSPTSRRSRGIQYCPASRPDIQIRPLPKTDDLPLLFSPKNLEICPQDLYTSWRPFPMCDSGLTDERRIRAFPDIYDLINCTPCKLYLGLFLNSHF